MLALTATEQVGKNVAAAAIALSPSVEPILAGQAGTYLFETQFTLIHTRY